MINERKVLTILSAEAIWFLALLAFGSCKSQRVVTEYRERVIKDTVTQIDSVYISRIIKEKGDTVHITDTIFKFKYLDKYKYIHVHDSVPYEVQVQVPVRVRNGYDRFTSWGFWIFLAIAALRLAFWFVKKYYLRV